MGILENKVLRYLMYLFIGVCCLEVLIVVFDSVIGDGHGDLSIFGISNKISNIKFWLGLSFIYVFWVRFILLKKHETLLNLTVLTSVFIIMVAVVELIFYLFIVSSGLMAGNNPVFEDVKGYRNLLWVEAENRNFWSKDAMLNYKHKPYTSFNAIYKYNDTLIYDVQCNIDSFGRRVTIPTSNPYHSIFFGGSFVFGSGVNDDETIPSKFSNRDSLFSGYNYGAICYGPNMMLSVLMRDNLRSEIIEKDGCFIYVYIDVHVKRALGGMRSCAWEGGANAPYFEIEDNKPVFKGSFASGRPFLTHLYKNLNKSNLVKYFGIDFPQVPGDSDYEYTVKLIKESKLLYEQKFGSDRFYVVIYPGYSNLIVPFLENEGIKVFDYSEGMFDRMAPGYSLAHDGHPTAMANEILTKQLLIDVRSEIENNNPL